MRREMMMTMAITGTMQILVMALTMMRQIKIHMRMALVMCMATVTPLR